jgi:hypothetical protein
VELSYDPSLVAAIYDEYGDQEWNRHETRPFHRVSFHIHRHYLNEFVHAGDLVLEAGAGAGCQLPRRSSSAAAPTISSSRRPATSSSMRSPTCDMPRYIGVLRKWVSFWPGLFVPSSTPTQTLLRCFGETVKGCYY